MSNKVKFSIHGMHCAACSSRIERVVGNLPEVAEVTVSLATNTAQIQFTEGTDSNDASGIIVNAVSKLGFTAELLAQESSDFVAEAAKRFDQQTAELQNELAQRYKHLQFALFFTLPLIVLSMGEMVGLHLPEWLSPSVNPLHFALAQLVLCLPVLLAGKRFYTSGIPALFRKSPNMDSLVALGTGAAFLYSVWQTGLIAAASFGWLDHSALPAYATAAESQTTFSQNPLLQHLFGGISTHGVELYYESAAMVIALVSVGKYMEIRSRLRTGEAIKSLLDLAPESALRLTPHTGLDAPYSSWKEEEIPLSAVKKGDILLVRPGSRLPVDGTMLEGSSYVDESMLTGESMPIQKSIGHILSGGTMNQTGAIYMRTDHVGADTVLARIVRMVQEAQSSKASIANLADTVSLYFVHVVIFIAITAGLFWLWHTHNHAFALRIFVSVMIIACPCAMGLATPMSIMVGSGRGARLGILFKNGQALEATSHLNMMVFDKTGTLTLGKPTLMGSYPLHDEETPSPAYDMRICLQLAASLESASEHPLAEAIRHEALMQNIDLLPCADFTAIPGKGVQGTVTLHGNPLEIAIGNGRFAAELMNNTNREKNVQTLIETHAAEGKTPVVLLVGKQPVALFTIADPIRKESAATIASLQAQGITTVMLTGDNPITAQAIAKEAGISIIHAGVLPGQKLEIIEEFQRNGYRVGMVGDGINDAPALARSDVGFAVQSGTDIAMETGDVVLMRHGIAAIYTAVALGKATMRNIKQNLFWAFAYNIIGIPFAAGIFYWFGGPTLSPMLAGAAMAFSSVCVVSNALRLRFFSPPPQSRGQKV